tara:strand:- start:2851 stop:4515 length:1665 start_codon:yes stop_codon:yes gene_type:complete
MSNYINEALLDSSPMKKQQEESKHLVNKWDKTGLLDGLNEDFKRQSMAVLLENQAKQLINEFSNTSPNAGVAGGNYKGDEEWSGVALPLVRRIFGEIAAQEFVSVQPMNLPSGLVFYLDFQHGKTRGGFTAGDSIHGKTGPNSPSGSSAPFGEGGFYGAGKYGYTATTSSHAVASPTVAVASLADINYDSEITSSANAGQIFKVTKALTGLGNIDRGAIRAATLLSGSDGNVMNGGGDVNKVFAQHTSITGDEGADGGTITFIVSASTALSVSGDLTAELIKSNTESSRGDFEDASGDATKDALQIPEVDLKLRSRPIVAKTRKLKAVWTPELAQDLNAYHSVDAEAELTSMLSEYISMEIDLEILDMLLNDATTTEYWSARVGKHYDSNTSSFSNITDGLAYTRFEWYQTLVEKIQKVSNTIHQLTLRGGANFVVVSPKVATILESIPGYAASTDGDKAQFAMGVSQVGSVAGRFQVYKNPYMTENAILVGFRGSNFLETGAVYAPYVPLIMTPLVYDPSDFTPRKGVMTRYAKKMIRPEFYGKIYCSDLNLV